MNQPTLIMEGFICPECQQDLTNAELLQAHFELVHSKGNKNGPSYKRLAASNSKNNLQNGDSGFSCKQQKILNNFFLQNRYHFPLNYSCHCQSQKHNHLIRARKRYERV